MPLAATNVVAIAAGYSHSLALLADGSVLAWGTGVFGATNIPNGLANVARIAAGQNYSLVMVEQGPPGSVAAPQPWYRTLAARRPSPRMSAAQVRWLSSGITTAHPLKAPPAGSSCSPT